MERERERDARPKEERGEEGASRRRGPAGRAAMLEAGRCAATSGEGQSVRARAGAPPPVMERGRDFWRVGGRGMGEQAVDILFLERKFWVRCWIKEILGG